MSPQTEEVATEDEAPIRLALSEEKAERILDHAENLEQTQVSYLWPLLAGILVGIAVPVGLLFASL